MAVEVEKVAGADFADHEFVGEIRPVDLNFGPLDRVIVSASLQVGVAVVTIGCDEEIYPCIAVRGPAPNQSRAGVGGAGEVGEGQAQIVVDFLVDGPLEQLEHRGFSLALGGQLSACKSEIAFVVGAGPEPPLGGVVQRINPRFGRRSICDLESAETIIEPRDLGGGFILGLRE